MKVSSISLSVIIPVYNECENIPLLHERLSQILKKQEVSYEIIYVDDGSTDDTFMHLQALAQRDQQVGIIQLRRNFGQTAAMAAGIDYSVGEILVFMDGDLQNDPIDIPCLLEELEKGYDVVSGWRKNRQDALLSRKLPSWLANRLISKITGVPLHDYGCTLKAYRRDIFQHVRLYGEMHRFLPAYAALAGASIAEIKVNHHPRKFGKSKYGISRTIRVLLDLITLKFFERYRTRPHHAFGVPALLALLLGNFLAAEQICCALFSRRTLSYSPFMLPLYLIGLGLQCLMQGLSAEMLTRIYYEAQSKPVYVVRNVLPASHLQSRRQGMPEPFISFPTYQQEA
jgi:glycosyltransferase involved in cell wall biosynthesis